MSGSTEQTSITTRLITNCLLGTYSAANRYVIKRKRANALSRCIWFLIFLKWFKIITSFITVDLLADVERSKNRKAYIGLYSMLA